MSLKHFKVIYLPKQIEIYNYEDIYIISILYNIHNSSMSVARLVLVIQSC